MVVGDALLTVRGTLVLAEGNSARCTLSLSPLEDKTPQFYNSRSIKAEYYEDFTVAPTRRDYRLRIDCPGYVAIVRTVESIPPVTRIEMGAVSPTRMSAQ